MKFCQGRFKAQWRIMRDLAGVTETNIILEKIRSVLKELVPDSLESCVLLLDSNASSYTRPLRCDLYDRPMSCIACKRSRPAVQRAIAEKKPVVVNQNIPITRPGGARIPIGAEAAIPILDREHVVLAAISLVVKPDAEIDAEHFLILKDTTQTAGHLIMTARSFWRVSQEKLHLAQELGSLRPFVPQSVRQYKWAALPDEPGVDLKEETFLSVLFLDIEGYTRLSQVIGGREVSNVVERIFSSFVDLIHRSGGDINETAGDGLMIIFKDGSPKENASNAMAASLDIHQTASVVAAGLVGPAQGLKLNMGIASGLALVGPSRFVGSEYTRMTFTASGNVTNLAARLSDLAQGGEILVCPETRELLFEQWPLFDRGEMVIKGLEDTVRVYSPLANKPSPRTLPSLGNEM